MQDVMHDWLLLILAHENSDGAAHPAKQKRLTPAFVPSHPQDGWWGGVWSGTVGRIHRCLS